MFKQIDKSVTNFFKTFFKIQTSLGEYNSKFSEHISWYRMLEDEKTVILKHGALMQSFKLEFFDLDFASVELETILYNTFQDVLKKIDRDVVYHFESRRIIDNNYKTKEYKRNYEAAKLINLSRESKYKNINHYKTSHYISITMLLSDEIEDKFSKLYTKKLGNNDEEIRFNEEVNKFKEIIEYIKTSFEGTVTMQKGMKVLSGEELYGFLYGCVNSEFNSEKVKLFSGYLDYDLSCSSFEKTTNSLKINGKHCRIINIKGYPNYLYTRMLRNLEVLNFEYRIVNRFIPMQKEEVQKFSKERLRFWRGKRVNLLKALLNKYGNDSGALAKYQGEDEENTIAARNADEVKLVQELIDEDVTIFGFYTSTIIVLDEDEERLSKKIATISTILKNVNFLIEPFKLNLLPSFEGSIPGNFISNQRRDVISLHNVSYLTPTSTPYLGEKNNNHFQDIALLYANSNTNNTFNFNLHVEDIGHTLIIGSTGGGKSVLLGTIINGFLKYKDAQVFVFDRGASIRVSAYLNSGQLYDIGKNDISFQPLSRINDPAERVWARNFIISLLKFEGVEITSEINEDIDEIFKSLINDSVEKRTISNFIQYSQNEKIRRSLVPYTKKGIYGQFFDGDSNSMGYNNFQVFEMGEIINDTKLSVLVLDIIFHQIEKRLLAGNPTLIVLDEAAAYLKHELFAEKIEDYMRTLRKKNASLVIATQQVTDITELKNEKLRDSLITSTSTRIYLPNASAKSTFYESYKKMKLSDKEITALEKAEKKKEYIIQQENRGTAKIDLNLSRFELDYVATANMQEQNKIIEIRKAFELELNKIQKESDMAKVKLYSLLEDNDFAKEYISSGKMNEFGGRTELSYSEQNGLKLKIEKNLKKIEELKIEVEKIESKQEVIVKKMNLLWLISRYEEFFEYVKENQLEQRYKYEIHFYQEIIKKLNKEIGE